MQTYMEPQIHRWTREEYNAMGEIGLFDGRHVQLIEGQVVEMSPMGSPHVTAVSLTQQALQQVFGSGYYVRTQATLDMGEASQPEPDVAVVLGTIRDFKNAHPASALLVVEVADSSLDYDRHEKASLYAKHGIADYWLLNLIDRQLEVHRQPQRNPTQPFGFDYHDVTIIKPGGSIAPLARSDVQVQIDDLLP